MRFHLYLPDPFRCKMDMFSSETGVWKELVVVSPRKFGVYCNDSFPRAGFPYKGKLYWAGTGGVMALDPVAYNGNNSSGACEGREVFGKCYFVELDEVKLPVHLDKFVCESRGMLCLVAHRRVYKDVHIWEMKEDVEDGCCFTVRHRVCLLPRMERSGLWRRLYDEREATRLLPLDSFDEDTMYLQSSRSIFVCNIRTRKILKITNGEVIHVLPFALP